MQLQSQATPGETSHVERKTEQVNLNKKKKKKNPKEAEDFSASMNSI